MPRVMISGWTLKTPMPMPLTRPASPAATEGEDERRDRPDERRLGRDDERRHRGHHADGQVDAAGQHAEGLAAGESASGTAARSVDADPHGSTTLAGRPGSRPTRITSSPIRGTSGRSRISRRRPHRRRDRSHARPGAHARRPPHRRDAAEHDDADEDRPWTTVAGSGWRPARSGRCGRGRAPRPPRRPAMPPRPPARLHRRGRSPPRPSSV